MKSLHRVPANLLTVAARPRRAALPAHPCAGGLPIETVQVEGEDVVGAQVLAWAARFSIETVRRPEKDRERRCGLGA